MKTARQPSEPKRRFVRIVRPLARHSIIGHILTDEPIIFHVHRFMRRTVPCLDGVCSFCVKGIPKEERIYLPILNQISGDREFLDLPVAHFDRMITVGSSESKLSGMIIRSRRKYPADNAPIINDYRPIKTADQLGQVITDYVEWIEAILDPNLEFALSQIETAKLADGGSP